MVNPTQRMERREELLARLAVLEHDVEMAHGRLFGNGQPGELQKIRLEIELASSELATNAEERHKTVHARLIRLERLAWIGLGVFIGVNVIRELPGLLSLLHK